MLRNRPIRRWHAALVPLALLVSTPAHAHLVSTRFGEFYAGLLHPLTTLSHVVPWVALGLLAAVQGMRGARWNLLAFPLAVAIGVLLGSWLPGFDAGLQWGNIASIVLLGALLATAVALPMPVFLGLSVVFGLSHGYTNVVSELEGRALLLYTTGVACAGYLLVALLGASALVVVRQNWGLVAVRALGSWILAAGVIYAGFSLLGQPGA